VPKDGLAVDPYVLVEPDAKRRDVQTFLMLVSLRFA
jgi:hypothetical protein